MAMVVANIGSWQLEDADVYWNAALRLRHGGDLYPISGLQVGEPYRYAPWFAWAWVPLTYVPKLAVQVAWSSVLVAATGVAIWPLLRSRSVAGICLAGIMGGLLLRTATTGNVHALLVAGLLTGLSGRSGPIWIGLAASLKVAPIAFVLLYLGRREWGRAAAAVAVTTALWAPAMLYDLSSYPRTVGDSISILSWAGVWPWMLVALLASAFAIGLARTRYGALAASVATLAVLPRLLIYDLTWLLVGAVPGTSRGDFGMTSRQAGSGNAR
jgi:hypothetical protein